MICPHPVGCDDKQILARDIVYHTYGLFVNIRERFCVLSFLIPLCCGNEFGNMLIYPIYIKDYGACHAKHFIFYKR